MFNIKQGDIFPTKFYSVDIFEHDELWEHEVFKPLLEKTTAITQSIIENLSKNRPQMVIRSMWGNINPKGGMNFTHVHPSGWMSYNCHREQM
jgi:hypothetical protein